MTKAPVTPAYFEQMRCHVDEGGQLNHRNGVDLLAEVERLTSLYSTAPYPKSNRDPLGRRLEPAPMPEALKDSIATCYGLLWGSVMSDARTYRARRGLLQWLTQDEQVRGIEAARGVELLVGIPPSLSEPTKDGAS